MSSFILQLNAQNCTRKNELKLIKKKKKLVWQFSRCNKWNHSNKMWNLLMRYNTVVQVNDLLHDVILVLDRLCFTFHRRIDFLQSLFFTVFMQSVRLVMLLPTLRLSSEIVTTDDYWYRRTTEGQKKFSTAVRGPDRSVGFARLTVAVRQYMEYWKYAIRMDGWDQS